MATYRNYHPGSIKNAFEAIQNKDDWREPIDAIVAEQSLPITVDAIAFYTATETTVEPVGYPGAPYDPDQRYYRVKSIGYRAGPAGP